MQVGEQITRPVLFFFLSMVDRGDRANCIQVRSAVCGGPFLGLHLARYLLGSDMWCGANCQEPNCKVPGCNVGTRSYVACSKQFGLNFCGGYQLTAVSQAGTMWLTLETLNGSVAEQDQRQSFSSRTSRLLCFIVQINKQGRS